jgi:predicted ribosome quality control (RQC) complex YloA/Tae2 family protein
VAGDLAADLGIFDDATLLWKALLDLVEGLSPTLAREVVYVATGAVDTPLGGHRNLESVAHLLALIRERFGPERGQPSAVWQGERLAEWAAFPLYQHGVEPRRYPEIAALLEEVYATRADADGLAGQRGPLLGQIEALRKTARRKIASLESSLADPEALRTLRERGEMILAYQHSIEPGQRELSIPELGLTIPLETALTPLENAQRAFKQYQKRRDAAAVVPGLLEAARHELEYLDQLAVHAAVAADPAALAAVRDDLREATGQGKAQKKGRGQDKRGQPGKGGKAKPGVTPLRVRAADGTEILVGRSARQNDAVTFQLAHPQDLWLHARQIPGAHVILRTGGRPPSKETLLQAATLAASHSQARAATTVPVDYTAVRNVRRIKGARPGLVSYSGETTINVRPSG